MTRTIIYTDSYQGPDRRRVDRIVPYPDQTKDPRRQSFTCERVATIAIALAVAAVVTFAVVGLNVWVGL